MNTEAVQNSAEKGDGNTRPMAIWIASPCRIGYLMCLHIGTKLKDLIPGYIRRNRPRSTEGSDKRESYTASYKENRFHRERSLEVKKKRKGGIY